MYPSVRCVEFVSMYDLSSELLKCSDSVIVWFSFNCINIDNFIFSTYIIPLCYFLRKSLLQVNSITYLRYFVISITTKQYHIMLFVWFSSWLKILLNIQFIVDNTWLFVTCSSVCNLIIWMGIIFSFKAVFWLDVN